MQNLAENRTGTPCRLESRLRFSIRTGALLNGTLMATTMIVGSLEVRADEAADVADLRFGGSVAGEISPYQSESGKGRLVKVSPKLIMAIPEVEVRRVRENDAKIVEYQRLLAAAPQTAEAHWAISQWCNAQRLSHQKQRHLERVIELDPNHGPARQELGYFPDGNNGWRLNDAVRRERGLLREDGKWKYAEEVMVERNSGDVVVSRKEWLRKLPGLKKQVVRGGIRGTEAANEIQNLNDPAADEAVAQEFTTGADRDRFPRMMWLEILGRLRTSISVNTIVQSALNDPSDAVRERCYELLNDYGKYQAIPYFVRLLKDKNNATVRMAGRALTYLNDPEIALDLVEALETTHKYEAAPGNEMNIGMSPDGSGGLGGMQMGGKKVVINQPLKNPEVLDALLEIVPEGVNFQYDKDRWRLYFASQLSPRPRDMRRDP